MKKLFIFLLTLICIPSVAAYESYITRGGYKTVPNVEVNWNYIEQLSTDTDKKIITKSKKKTAKKHTPLSPYNIITKTIIIDSSTIKRKLSAIKDYVVVQPNQKNFSYVQPSDSSNTTTGNAEIKEKSKIKKITKKIMAEKLKETTLSQKYLPTQNIVVEKPRFLDEEEPAMNNRILLATKDLIAVYFDKYKKFSDKKEEQPSQVIARIDDQYADVNNPFEDEFDVPTNVESLSEPKKKQAPSFNPLLRFPLSQYTVKGVITSLKGNRALITTSQGNSFYVKEGEFIGNNKGVIQEIKNNSIIIVEKDRRIEIIISATGRVSNR